MKRRTIGELCRCGTSNLLQKSLEPDSGPYPVFGASGEITRVSFCQESSPYIGMVKDGAGIGKAMRLPGSSSTIGTMMRLVPLEGVDLDYLFHAFQSLHLAEYRTGSTIPHIYFRDFRNTEIPSPAFSEQRKIANIFNTICSLVERRQAQLAHLDTLAKSLFVEMFGDKEWPTVPTSYVLHELRNGVSPSTTGSCLEKVLTLSAITRGRFDPALWKEGMFHESPGNDYRISTSDFYIVRGNGNRSLVGLGEYSNEDHHDLVFPDTIIAGRVSNEVINLPFLREVWRLPATRRQIESAARSTNGTYKINQKAVLSTIIPLPPLPLQNVFASRVEAIDKSKFAIRKSLDELNRLYRSLLQQYFG